MLGNDFFEDMTCTNNNATAKIFTLCNIIDCNYTIIYIYYAIY